MEITINFLEGLWKDSIRSHNIWQCLWTNSLQNALKAPFILCANTIFRSIGGSWILPLQTRKMRLILLYQTLYVEGKAGTSFLDCWIHKHRHWERYLGGRDSLSATLKKQNKTKQKAFRVGMSIYWAPTTLPWHLWELQALYRGTPETILGKSPALYGQGWENAS